MQNDVLFFLAILIFFFAVWLVGGGPTKPISFAGPYITPITNVNQTQDGYGDQIDTNTRFSVGGFSFGFGSREELRAGIADAQDSLAALQQDLKNKTLFGEPSPYRGQVTVSAAGVAATDPDTEYVTVRVSSDAPENLTITGWSLVSAASGKSERVGEGRALPRYGGDAPIVLHPGDTAYIITGESPLGYSFKENQCTGYLARTQRFVPSIGQSCPSPLAEFNRYYSGNALKDDRCYALMQRTQTCAVPEESRDLTGACQRLIDDHLTYTGCVDTHRYDAYFTNGAWHIYLEREQERGGSSSRSRGELWKASRDGIKLLDANGKTVDLYTY